MKYVDQAEIDKVKEFLLSLVKLIKYNLLLFC